MDAARPDIVEHCARHHTAEAYAGYLAKPETAIVLAEAVPGGAPVGYAMLTTPELPSFAVRQDDLELKAHLHLQPLPPGLRRRCRSGCNASAGHA